MAEKAGMEADGRLLVPAALRDAMGIREGDTLIASVVDGELRLIARDRAIERVQKRVRAFVPADASLVDKLIAERRREAEREEDETPGSPATSRSR